MATSDLDSEQLISRFCGSLTPGDRSSFRQAAEAALEQIPCAGEGILYRTLVPLWRSYFHPPPDPRIGQTRGSGIRRPSKLISAPALGEDGPRVGERDRRQFQAG